MTSDTKQRKRKAALLATLTMLRGAVVIAAVVCTAFSLVVFWEFAVCGGSSPCSH